MTHLKQEPASVGSALLHGGDSMWSGITQRAAASFCEVVVVKGEEGNNVAIMVHACDGGGAATVAWWRWRLKALNPTAQWGAEWCPPLPNT
ncbi:hypothetical protein L1987_13194 [Smallanthus sonchifolius]|uniref:Uncharacterized protein n=1 Tax=Smallanthus sonchifolius TaxID=185202 RepID=A0ACB9JIJ5_9ASTR|nr:hypothetical protein L1987_13194 [Smallanthus sonchifolius]